LVYLVSELGGTVESLRRLERMARVLVSPLRIRIMAALSVRPMSPKMFQEAYGGGELSRIDENFKVLERNGWLELLETQRGGKRRGGTEHLYRARQLPIFDSYTWPALPEAMREMYSWWVLGTLTNEAKRALDAGTFDSRPDRHFTWTPGLGDQLAWTRIVDRTDSVFEFVLDEIKGAAPRLAETGEKRIPATFALAAFESPSDRFTEDARLDPMSECDAYEPSLHRFSMRMAKAMLDPLRILILAELGTRAMSAKKFFEEFGGGEITRDMVYRAFRTLRYYDWLVLAYTDSGGRRGGVERFYRVARPPILHSDTWPAVPAPLKDMASAKVLDTMIGRFKEAMEAGTLDSRTDRHFTWTPGVVDQLGWERIVKRMDALFDFVRAELKRAESRLAKSGEKPIPMTIALAVFESPAASSRVH
jgi:DNA-binding transcriptional ArsR family regulator